MFQVENHADHRVTALVVAVLGATPPGVRALSLAQLHAGHRLTAEAGGML
jgi:hypothetical protein